MYIIKFDFYVEFQSNMNDYRLKNVKELIRNQFTAKTASIVSKFGY